MPDGTYDWVLKMYSELFPHLVPYSSDSEPTDEYFLQYDADNDKVVWAQSSITVALDDITDVVITTAAKYHHIENNGTNWVNLRKHTVSAASGEVAYVIRNSADTDDLFQVAVEDTKYGGAGTDTLLTNTQGSINQRIALVDGGSIDVAKVQIRFSNDGFVASDVLAMEIDGSQNVRIYGDFQVDGTTTTYNSTVVTVDDPIFTLGGDTPPTSDDGKDRGIEMRYHTGAEAKIAFMGWDNDQNNFTFLSDATNSSEIMSGTKADIVIAGLYTNSITFDAVSDTIAGIENQNLVDKTVAETITDSWVFNNNIDFMAQNGLSVLGGANQNDRYINFSNSSNGIDSNNQTVSAGITTAGEFFIDQETAAYTSILRVRTVGGSTILHVTDSGIQSNGRGLFSSSGFEDHVVIDRTASASIDQQIHLTASWLTTNVTAFAISIGGRIAMFQESGGMVLEDGTTTTIGTTVDTDLLSLGTNMLTVNGDITGGTGDTNYIRLGNNLRIYSQNSSWMHVRNSDDTGYIGVAASKLNITSSTENADGIYTGIHVFTGDEVEYRTLANIASDGGFLTATGGPYSISGAWTWTATLNSRTILPTLDSTYDLGSAGFLYTTVYAQNISTAGVAHDVDEIANITKTQTWTTRPTFNGGDGSNPPFYVDSSVKVTNLNADFLDGVSSGSFAILSEAETVTNTWTMRTILPQTDDTYHLGGVGALWNTLYVNNISEGSYTIDIDDIAVINIAKNISAIWTFDALPAFNGGTSGVSAPFTVDSTYVVANLNADMVDGINGGSFLRSDANDTATGLITLTYGSLLLQKATANNYLDLDADTGYWGYTRHRSGTNYFDVAVKSDDLSGALQFRVDGGNTRAYIDRSADYYGRHVLPVTTSTYNLGSTSLLYNTVYTDNLSEGSYTLTLDNIADISTTKTITGVWTFDARPAFNGGTSGATSPFTVDSTYVVANLNADMLDGYHASSFQNNTGVVYSATNLAVGWHTIATQTGDRAIGRFAIKEVSSGNHQSAVFYASHSYGIDVSNGISVLNYSRYGTGTLPVRYIRIVDGGTYDGAQVQIYIANATNSVYVYLLGDNVQSSGWVLSNFASPSGTLTEATKVDLNQVSSGGMIATGDIYTGGQTTQYKVLTTADEGSGNGIDADTLDTYHATSFPRKSEAATITNNWVMRTITPQTDTTYDLGGVGATYNTLYVQNISEGSYTVALDDFMTTQSTNVLAGSYAFNTIPQFNGGTSGVNSPFTVDSTFLVTNLNADLLDGVQGSSYLRSDTSDTFTGTLTVNGDINGNGQQLILNAGEAISYRTGQTNEYIYMNAESGLEINTTPDNWGTGWAGRQTTYISGSAITVNGNTVWNAGNDGSGSGLDADLLDTYHASSFPRKAEAATITNNWIMRTITPQTDTTYNLGSATNTYSTIYVQNISEGSLTLSFAEILSTVNAQTVTASHTYSSQQLFNATARIGGTASDPASDSYVTLGVDGASLRAYSNHGYIDIGPKNTSYCHIYTDRAEFYFNKEIKINGTNVSKSGHTHSYQSVAACEDYAHKGSSNSGWVSLIPVMDTDYFTVSSDGTFAITADEWVRFSIPLDADRGSEQLRLQQFRIMTVGSTSTAVVLDFRLYRINAGSIGANPTISLFTSTSTDQIFGTYTWDHSDLATGSYEDYYYALQINYYAGVRIVGAQALYYYE